MFVRIFLLVVFLQFALAALLENNEHCEGDGLTVGCRPHQELTHMITRLKSEVYRLKASADPNCTVCWSAPCLNGGTCIPLNVTEYSNEHCEGDGLTVGCRPHQELTHMITRLKSEVYRLKASADPNCTVCWSAPCLNGGTCIPLNVTEYRCDCPPDYSGKICQTHMECHANTCGANADCFVTNHQINCVCQSGYTEIPDEAALQGADVLCGLAGNRDFDCRNDFRKKDGTTYEGITSCNNYGREFTEEYGDTYITEDFLSLTQKPQQCLTGVEVTNGSITCELAEAKAKCLPILDAAKGNGVFAACKPLGEAFIKQAYDNCAYDTCQNSTMLCDSLANFARICQNNIF
uniref:EGF-like domain-containing protein n=1 Tax=Ascaris lumbricoides TaxID=6252 RepID=A0A0M3ILQ7_ASCLU